MKKIVFGIMILALLFALCACGTSGTISGDEAQEFVDGIIDDANQVIKDAGLDDVSLDGADDEYLGMANPRTEWTSLDEINGIVGSALAKPPVMGVTGEKYYTIDCGDFTMAEYCYEVSGAPYTFRCAPVADQDISGLYVGEGTAFADEPGKDEIEFCLESGVKAARWFTMDGQYVLIADQPDGMQDDAFKAVAKELCSLTATGMSEAEYSAFYADLAGKYQDKNSQRAMAEVTANGSESVTIVVTWANGAACREEWTMTAKLMEDGLICYHDLVQKELNYTSDTEYTEETVEFPADGWFEYVDGELLWTGAGDDSCSTCVFEKYL